MAPQAAGSPAHDLNDLWAVQAEREEQLQESLRQEQVAAAHARDCASAAHVQQQQALHELQSNLAIVQIDKVNLQGALRIARTETKIAQLEATKVKDALQAANEGHAELARHFESKLREYKAECDASKAAHDEQTQREADARRTVQMALDQTERTVTDLRRNEQQLIDTYANALDDWGKERDALALQIATLAEHVRDLEQGSTFKSSLRRRSGTRWHPDSSRYEEEEELEEQDGTALREIFERRMMEERDRYREVVEMHRQSLESCRQRSKDTEAFVRGTAQSEDGNQAGGITAPRSIADLGRSFRDQPGLRRAVEMLVEKEVPAAVPLNRAEALEKILRRQQPGGEAEHEDGLDAASAALLDRSNALLRQSGGENGGEPHAVGDSLTPSSNGHLSVEVGANGQADAPRAWESGFDSALDGVVQQFNDSESSVRSHLVTLHRQLDQVTSAKDLASEQLVKVDEARRRAEEDAARTTKQLHTERTKLWMAIHQLDAEGKKREQELRQAKSDMQAAIKDAQESRADLHVVNQQCVQLRKELYAMDHHMLQLHQQQRPALPGQATDYHMLHLHQQQQQQRNPPGQAHVGRPEQSDSFARSNRLHYGASGVGSGASDFGGAGGAGRALPESVWHAPTTPGMSSASRSRPVMPDLRGQLPGVDDSGRVVQHAVQYTNAGVLSYMDSSAAKSPPRNHASAAAFGDGPAVHDSIYRWNPQSTPSYHHTETASEVDLVEPLSPSALADDGRTPVSLGRGSATRPPDSDVHSR